MLSGISMSPALGDRIRGPQTASARTGSIWGFGRAPYLAKAADLTPFFAYAVTVLAGRIGIGQLAATDMDGHKDTCCLMSVMQEKNARKTCGEHPGFGSAFFNHPCLIAHALVAMGAIMVAERDMEKQHSFNFNL